MIAIYALNMFGVVASWFVLFAVALDISPTRRCNRSCSHLRTARQTWRTGRIPEDLPQVEGLSADTLTRQGARRHVQLPGSQIDLGSKGRVLGWAGWLELQMVWRLVVGY